VRERRSFGVMCSLFFLDALWSSLAWIAAFALRFYTPLFDSLMGPAQSPVPINSYLWALPVLVSICAFGGWLSGFYTVSGLTGRQRLGPRLRTLFLTLVMLLAASALYRGASYSRLVAVLLFVFLIPGPALNLWLVRSVLARLRVRGFAGRPVLIIGEGALAKALHDQLKENPWLGFDPRMAEGDVALDPDKIEGLCLKDSIEEVFVAVPLAESQRWLEFESRFRGLPVDFHIVIDGQSFLTIRPRMSFFGDFPILTVRESPRYGWNRVIKRVFDLIFGSLTALLLAPVMVFIALAIKLSSRGPILYCQERVSWAGRRFTMVKFRTMVPEAESAGPQFAVRNDPRRTLIGAFLRVSSLDELPQLWNVLRGEMSLVGPRPERPEFLREIAERLPHFPLRQSVKAGMTGWAQIHGQRGQAPLEDRLRFDLDYVQNWSIWLDLRILVVTMFGGFLSRNAI
jgi:exopolysaccharide biosynthesis polyprenyl glycosylphosphotransferase